MDRLSDEQLKVLTFCRENERVEAEQISAETRIPLERVKTIVRQLMSMHIAGGAGDGSVIQVPPGFTALVEVEQERRGREAIERAERTREFRETRRHNRITWVLAGAAVVTVVISIISLVRSCWGPPSNAAAPLPRTNPATMAIRLPP